MVVSVYRRLHEHVVEVVPPFAKRNKGNKPIIARLVIEFFILRTESTLPPHVGSAVHEPCRMLDNKETYTASPQKSEQCAFPRVGVGVAEYCRQYKAQNNPEQGMVIEPPHHRVITKSIPHVIVFDWLVVEQPSEVRMPESSDTTPTLKRCVRVQARLITLRVVCVVFRTPDGSGTLYRHVTEDTEYGTYPLVRLKRLMGEVSMVADGDAKTRECIQHESHDGEEWVNTIS
jgi:hypothetical protein